jgi:hypothetical protein
VGDREGIAWALLISGTAAWVRGQHQVAAPPLQKSILAFQSLGGLWGLAVGLLLAAQLARARGHWEQAARLFGASEALHEVVGAPLMPFVKAWGDEAITEANAALDPEEFEHAWQEGRALAPDAAVSEAIRELDQTGPSRTGRR